MTQVPVFPDAHSYIQKAFHPWRRRRYTLFYRFAHWHKSQLYQFKVGTILSFQNHNITSHINHELFYEIRSEYFDNKLNNKYSIPELKTTIMAIWFVGIYIWVRMAGTIFCVKILITCDKSGLTMIGFSWSLLLRYLYDYHMVLHIRMKYIKSFGQIGKKEEYTCAISITLPQNYAKSCIAYQLKKVVSILHSF